MAPNPCPPPQPSVFTKEVQHVYRMAGRVTVAVQPTAFPFCAPGMPMPINGHLQQIVAVDP